MTATKHPSGDGRRDRHGSKRHQKRHKTHPHNPCPHGPRQLDTYNDELFGEFHRHHGHKRHNHWRADLRWIEINVDTDGFPLKVLRYQVELQISGNGTDWFDSSRHSVPAKDDDDPNEKVHLRIHHIHGRLAYRYRVRAISEKCKAEWSDYFVIGTPEDGPPAPNDVRIMRASHGLRVRWHSRPDDHDDELFDEKVAYSICELWTNPDFGPVRNFTADASTNAFTVNSHGFEDGDQVMVASNLGEDLLLEAGSSLPNGVKAWKVYLVDSKTTNTFKLRTDENFDLVDLTSNGAGQVFWGLVRKTRHNHHHHHHFRLDVEDFPEDVHFYGRVKNVSDHRSSSAWIPATAPSSNDDPDAEPTGRRPAWHRHVWTFSPFEPIGQGTYFRPQRSDDDYKIRRVTCSFHKGGDGHTRIDVIVNGDRSVFGNDTAKMLHLNAGDRDASTNDIVHPRLNRGDHLRIHFEDVPGSPPRFGSIQVIADRIGNAGHGGAGNPDNDGGSDESATDTIDTGGGGGTDEELPDAPPPVMDLGDITDVDTSGADDGQILRWSYYAGAWVVDDDGVNVQDDGADVGLFTRLDFGTGLDVIDNMDGSATVDAAGSGASAFADLTDVDVTGLGDGQVMKWDAGSSLWLPADDDTGSGTDSRPALGRAAYEAAPLGAYDDEFEDGSIAGAWTDVHRASSPGSWVERYGAMHYKHTGSATNGDLHALVKSGTISVGDYIEARLSAFSRDNHLGVGLIFADGNSFGAGNQVFVLWYNYKTASNFWRIESLTNYAGSSTGGTTFALESPGVPWYVRLKYVAANTWGYYLSMDGFTWWPVTTAFSKSMTPTHFGIVVDFTQFQTAPQGSAVFDYFRVNPADE